MQNASHLGVRPSTVQAVNPIQQQMVQPQQQQFHPQYPNQQQTTYQPNLFQQPMQPQYQPQYQQQFQPQYQQYQQPMQPQYQQQFQPQQPAYNQQDPIQNAVSRSLNLLREVGRYHCQTGVPQQIAQQVVNMLKAEVYNGTFATSLRNNYGNVFISDQSLYSFIDTKFNLLMNSMPRTNMYPQQPMQPQFQPQYQQPQMAPQPMYNQYGNGNMQPYQQQPMYNNQQPYNSGYNSAPRTLSALYSNTGASAQQANSIHSPYPAPNVENRRFSSVQQPATVSRSNGVFAPEPQQGQVQAQQPAQQPEQKPEQKPDIDTIRDQDAYGWIPGAVSEIKEEPIELKDTSWMILFRQGVMEYASAKPTSINAEPTKSTLTVKDVKLATPVTSVDEIVSSVKQSLPEVLDNKQITNVSYLEQVNVPVTYDIGKKCHEQVLSYVKDIITSETNSGSWIDTASDADWMGLGTATINKISVQGRAYVNEISKIIVDLFNQAASVVTMFKTSSGQYGRLSSMETLEDIKAALNMNDTTVGEAPKKHIDAYMKAMAACVRSSILAVYHISKPAYLNPEDELERAMIVTDNKTGVILKNGIPGRLGILMPEVKDELIACCKKFFTITILKNMTITSLEIATRTEFKHKGDTSPKVLDSRVVTTRPVIRVSGRLGSVPTIVSTFNDESSDRKLIGAMCMDDLFVVRQLC